MSRHHARAKLRRYLKRRTQRGTAVFIVSMTTVAISALGIYAMHSTSQLTRASGATRKLLQTHFVTDMAVLSTVANVRKTGGGGYVELMRRADTDTCYRFEDNMSKTCMILSYDDVEAKLSMSNAELLVPAVDNNPGSLGAAPLEGDFRIELTDLHALAEPIAGENLSANSTTNLKSYIITLTAKGEVRPKSLGNEQIDEQATTVASIERTRAHVVVGPIGL